MNMVRAGSLRHILASLVCTGLLCAAAGCGSAAPQQANGTSEQQTVGNVAIFTPNDGITLSSSTPLNTWDSWTPALAKALQEKGFDKSDIDTTSSSSLEKQSQDIQDYVVDHVESNDRGGKDDTNSDATHHNVLVVAPAFASDEATKYYGDFVDQSHMTTQSGTDSKDTAHAIQRLRSALTLAKDSGMRVVLVSNTIQGFVPDAFVSLSTPEQIGAMQATQLAAKLQLDKATTDNPKRIEVLLPYDADNAENAYFAQDAFAGVWSVLQPYFYKGVAISPSRTLAADSTQKDWESVTINATKSDQIEKALQDRLRKTDKEDATIDGIIAMNDFVASGVVEELDKLGYTGSAADINPSITLSSILNSLGGKQDLNKDEVPQPQGEQSSSAEDTQSKNTKRWPIVTGYGAYVSNLPSIVNGKQWITGFVNRDEVAHQTAQLASELNRGEKLQYATSTSIDGTRVPTLHMDIEPISAENLKTALIDPGYVSLADAGL